MNIQDRFTADDIILIHPDGRVVYPDVRITLADGTETTIEKIREERQK